VVTHLPQVAAFADQQVAVTKVVHDGRTVADAASLDGIRAALAGVTAAELRELAARALAATDAETVRALAAGLTARG